MYPQYSYIKLIITFLKKKKVENKNKRIKKKYEYSPRVKEPL
jgi:hypothetical protein